jgi:hypothetical protein
MLGAGSDTGDKKVMQKQKQKQNKKPKGSVLVELVLTEGTDGNLISPKNMG